MHTRRFHLQLAGLLFFAKVCAGQNTTIYTNDFEHGVGPEWTANGTAGAGATPMNAINTAWPSQRILGEFNPEIGALTLAAGAHASVIVSFDLYILKSWDGNGENCCGPDRFSLKVDGSALLNATFSNQGGVGDTQSYPNNYDPNSVVRNPAGTGSTGEGAPVGYRVYHISRTFVHSSPTLVLQFAASLTEGVNDESWGLDNISVSTSGCGRPTFTGPYPTASSPRSIRNPSGWHMSYGISDQHGLELTDVSLGMRYMAASMNLPYFYLKTSNFPDTNSSSEQRCTLTPNGLSGFACNSRLVDFQAVGGTAPEVKATYEVDNVSTTNQDACVLITQDYQFSPAIYPSLLHQVQGCEPTGSLPCAQFRPIVSYQFVPGDATETLTHINTAQQLHFRVDGVGPNSSAIFKDCDTPLCNPLAARV